MIEQRQSLRCPDCSAWLTFGAARCGYCGAAQAQKWTVDLARGRPIQSLSPERDSLPGLEASETAPERGARGMTVSLAALSVRFGTLPTRLVNACVTARVVGHGGETKAGVVARSLSEGAEMSGYAAELWPAERQWRLVRWVRSESGIEFDPVRDWTHAKIIAPEGEPNEIELRLGSTRLEVHVNGERVLAENDAFFGYGRCGWMARADRVAGDVTFASLDVFMLA